MLGKGTLLGTPNREPQEYSRYIIGIYLPGSLYSIIFLLYSWGSPFGVPSRVPLLGGCRGVGSSTKALSKVRLRQRGEHEDGQGLSLSGFGV